MNESQIGAPNLSTPADIEAWLKVPEFKDSALMVHEIVWIFDDGLRAKVECHGAPEAMCRWLAETNCECDTYYGMAVDEHGPYHVNEWYDGDLDRDVVDVHRMIYGGPCGVVMSMEEPAESAAQGVCFEIGRTKIDTVWDGDTYSWTPVLP